jgi:alkylated DNA repair dioxygenase AlkB
VFFEQEHIPLSGGGLDYYPAYINEPEQLLTELRDQVEWQQPELQVYGRRHPSPRLVSFVGDPGISYHYSSFCHQANAWPAALQELRRRIEIDTGYRFNCGLLNYYRDGRDCMGYHSDDEPALGSSPCVASVSLGEVRDFCLKPKTGGKAQKIALASGSLLLMLPPTQEHWLHALPARKTQSGGRINITFRHIINN